MSADGDGGETVIPIRKPIVIPDPAQEHIPKHNYLQWAALEGLEPPPFDWLLNHWLSWHPTLLAGRGGIGKSLLAQQLGTALACGLPTWCAAVEPVKVLYWACEDDHDQLWRRQALICKGLYIGMGALGSFHVDARHGFENTLLSTEFGRPMWTPLIEELRQQAGDFKADILILDNLGHTFGANENVRHDVTLFVNGIVGLVKDRPFCPILLGHPSKSINSEYSGSTAWENAVRMRWYLNDKMPDAKVDQEGAPDPDYRVLAKRKNNYTTSDYVEFRFKEGILVPILPENMGPGLMQSLHKQKSSRVLFQALRTLTEMGTRCTDSPNSPAFLPKLVLEFKLSEGCTKRELSEAMWEAMIAQKIVKGPVGKYSNRNKSEGLKLP